MGDARGVYVIMPWARGAPLHVCYAAIIHALCLRHWANQSLNKKLLALAFQKRDLQKAVIVTASVGRRASPSGRIFDYPAASNMPKDAERDKKQAVNDAKFDYGSIALKN
ncbi:MAG: hypothetical protein V6Z86_09695 [Hyphomicrobiales bacterium]